LIFYFPTELRALILIPPKAFLFFLESSHGCFLSLVKKDLSLVLWSCVKPFRPLLIFILSKQGRSEAVEVIAKVSREAKARGLQKILVKASSFH
jgi:hypothetical protein